MTKIKPFLWFDSNAAEARDFYLDVFKDSETLFTMADSDTLFKSGDAGGEPVGVTIRLNELEVTLFNGGPRNKLSEAFSLFVECEDQEEVDHYWDALTADGGAESACGWLTDKFGVSWQICPKMLVEVLAGADPESCQRAMQAMLGMAKLDIAELQAAYDGTA